MSASTALRSTTRTRRPFYRDLSLQVLAGIALGVATGVFAPHVGQNLKPLGDAFVRLVQMVVGPIIFCTVTQGIATVRDLGKVGRIAIKALLYFEVVTSIALVIGLVAANVMHAGSGMHVDLATLKGTDPSGTLDAVKHTGGIGDFLLDLIPTTAVGGFAHGDILQILFFSVLFACGLASIGERAQPVLDVIGAVSKALFWVIGLAMKLAPIAAFGAMAFTVAKFGLASLLSLGTLIVEFYGICLIFFVIVLAPICAYAGVSLLRLMRYIREELLLVLGTSSSESVFPQLTEKLENLGVEEQVVGLVLPTAYSFNHDGTCLYFAAVSVFLAEATGTAMTWHQQVVLLLILLLTSKGGAGVSGSAIAVLAMTLAATKAIPVGSIALVLGVHRVLSSAFVFTNITGNVVATLVVAKWENALDRRRLNQVLGGDAPNR